jgi:hypothetical protein
MRGNSIRLTAFRLGLATCSSVLVAAVLVAGQPSAPTPGQATGNEGSGQPGQRPRPVRSRDGIPPRDPAAAATGTARIRGVVVAADSGAPVRRAIVRINARELRDGRTTMTDNEGRFEVKELPAGRYTITVSKAGFVTLQYGQRWATQPGRPIDVVDGQSFDGVNFSLPRGGVVIGRLVDELGDPVAEAMVTASRYQFMRGQRRLMPASRPAQTNDLGQFRIYGLAPGDYVVAATVRSGNFFENTEETSGYAPTYFPGTSNPAEAQRVRVAIGQEAAADFALIPARLVRVSGSVLNSSGKPLTRGLVRLSDRGGADGPMFMNFQGGRIRGDGTFTIGGVAPGTYTLIATAADMPFGGGDGDDRDVEGTRMPLTVGSEDVTNVLVTTTRGAEASGQIVFEEGQATIPPGGIRIFAMAADPDDQLAGLLAPRGGSVKEDWTFELRNLFGRTMLMLNNLPGLGAGGASFGVKAVMLGGEDVTDRGFDTRPQQRIEGLQIVLTTRLTEVRGTVTDGRGRAVPDYIVVVFPEDATKWSLPFPRYLRTGRPDQDGRYAVTGLPPGEYLAAAVEFLESGNEADPEVLRRLQDIAMPLRLSDGEKKMMDLKLATTW